MSNDSSSRSVQAPSSETPGEGNGQATKTARWNVWGAIGIAVVLYVLAQIIAGGIISFYPHAQHWSKPRTSLWLTGVYIQFLYVVLAEALTVTGLVWYMRRRSLSFRAIGWRRFRLVNIVYALAGFGVYFVVYAALVSAVSSAIPDFNVNQHQDIGFSQVYGSGQLVVTFISLVVLPPLVEETLFRGFLFTTFRTRMRFMWAMLLTSLLFAAPHLLESDSGGPLWVGALDTFTVSLVLCYLREKTGNLWSGVLVHALKNGVAFLSLYVLHAH